MITTLEIQVETHQDIEPHELAYLVDRLILIAQDEIGRNPDYYAYEYQHGARALDCSVVVGE